MNGPCLFKKWFGGKWTIAFSSKCYLIDISKESSKKHDVK